MSSAPGQDYGSYPPALEGLQPRWSVRRWLVLLMLACLMPGVIGATLLLVHHYRHIRAQLESSTSQTSRALVQAVDSQLLRAEAVAHALSTNDSLAEHRFADFHRQARKALALADLGMNVVLIDETGQQIVNTARPFGGPLPVGEHAEGTRSVLPRMPAISGSYTGGVTHRLLASVDVPVVLDGRRTYVLRIGMPPNYFDNILRTQRLPAGWPAGIFDSAGMIVARTHAPERFVGQRVAPALLERLKTSHEGTLETNTKEGIPVISVYRRSPVTGWGVGIGIPRAELETQFIRSIYLLAVAVAGLFIVGFGLAWTIGGRIAVSITSLIGPARALGAHEPVPAVRVHITDVAEVATAMADASRVLDEREHALSVAKDAAEDANRAKSAFLRNMSHEMRTPLHIIAGLGHLLRRDLADPVQRQRLDQLYANADHLLGLIDEILDLSKIEAERLTLDQHDFRLGAVVDRVLAVVVGLARDKGLALTVDISPLLREAALKGDSLRLAQVLINLCGNAIKFTDEGGVRFTIEIHGETPSGMRLRFLVQDSGVGIDPADAGRVFEAFTQADASPARTHGGSGLGLAISQRLVGLMGGRIEIDSCPGAGSIFRFDLDLPRATGTPEAAPLIADIDLSDRRVLVADDHPLSQEILFEMLEGLGCEVDVAADGAEAVACAQMNAYDLILMDMQMPGMDGLAATRAIRILRTHAHTPIVALTANVFGEDRQRCLDAGMNGHLGKPVTPAKLAATLGRWLHGPAVPKTEKSASAPDNALARALAAIPELDAYCVYRRSADRLPEYCTLLHRYIAMHGGDMARVRDHLAAGELDAAQSVIHNLKGISGLIGARQVAAQATALHAALRAGSGEVTPMVEACAAQLELLAAAVCRLPQFDESQPAELPAT